jgi:hypothetical protein
MNAMRRKNAPTIPNLMNSEDEFELCEEVKN